MDFSDIVKQRYATKLFTGEDLLQEDLDSLLELIRYSASSYGLQPYKVVVVHNQELQEELKEAAWGQEQLTTASHVLVFCAYPNILERIEDYDEMMKQAGAPDDSREQYIATMNGSFQDKSQEEIAAWSQRQLYIAVGNAINGAKELGYDSCPMEGFLPEKFSEILQLPETLIPTAIVAVGVAADKPHEKIRYPDEQLFIHKN